MSECHFWIDRVTARHAEDLQICVLAVAFIYLQTGTKPNLGVPSVLHLQVQINNQCAHLLVLLNRLLLRFGDDALQFVEASLHLGEAEPGVLLFPAYPLQLLLTVFLGNAGALLPLLDTLREDLIDPADKNKDFKTLKK